MQAEFYQAHKIIHKLRLGSVFEWFTAVGRLIASSISLGLQAHFYNPLNQQRSAIAPKYVAGMADTVQSNIFCADVKRKN